MQQSQINNEASLTNCIIQYPSERYMNTTSYFTVCRENLCIFTQNVSYNLNS